MTHFTNIEQHLCGGNTLPKELDPSTIYIAGAVKARYIIFMCPSDCHRPAKNKCGKQIWLPLDRPLGPSWSYELHEDGTISIDQPINLRGCHCHYHITNSDIEWIYSWEGIKC